MTATSLKPMSQTHALRLGCGYLEEAKRAFEIQRDAAIANGQRWSEHHARIMMELQQSYVQTGRGQTKGRIAWPLSCGTGKTQSVVAMMKAQSELVEAGKPALSVLVCVERLAQIEDLFNEAVKQGVPERLMGKYSSQSLITDADEKLFLFATHSRFMRGDEDIKKVNTFRDNDRDLIVWDETLLHSRAVTLSLAQVRIALFALKQYAKTPGSDAYDVSVFLEDYCNRLDNKQSDAVNEFTKVSLSEENNFRFTKALQSFKPLTDDQRELLLQVVHHCGRPARVIEYRPIGCSDKDSSLYAVQFRTYVPDQLKRLVVLDASHTIRLLTSKHDKHVSMAEHDCNIKSFHTVKVKQYVQGSGREKLEKELPKGLDSPLVRKLVTDIGCYDPSESVLIVTMKHEAEAKMAGKKIKQSYEAWFKRAMKQAGLNPNDEQRFKFTTWGAGTVASNDYRDCNHIVAVGVLRRNKLDIAASIAAQRQDLETPYASDDGEIKRVELSEMFHHIIQCAGRGTCRKTVDGVAVPMTFTFACSDTFSASDWQAAMPGVQVEELKLKGKQGDGVRAILEALSVIPESHRYVTARTLKQLAGLSGMHPKTYTRTLKAASSAVSGWRYQGRSFVRISPFEIAA